MSGFDSPDQDVIEVWGEPVTFQPAAGGGPYELSMVLSTGVPDADVQPAPLVVLFGTLLDSGFEDAGAPVPQKDDAFTVGGLLYDCYLVKTDRAGGTPSTNGLWCYLTQMGG